MNALTIATHGRIGYAIEYDTYIAAGGGGAGLAHRQEPPIVTVGTIKIIKKKKYLNGAIEIKSLKVI